MESSEEIKNKEKIGVGIGVLVIDETGKMLIGKRKSKFGKNEYALPGGHLEFQESFESCAARELKEETNIDGEDFEVVSLANDVIGEKHYVTIGLIARKYNGKAELMEPDKCESWGWFGLDDLPKPLFLPSKEIIDSYSNKQIYHK